MSDSAISLGPSGAPAEHGCTINSREQELADEHDELEERTEELAAARAANRELTRALNHAG
ncbi:hypothetical protein [Streptomyces sp. NPDC056663]|uniref:hypothetical protein n=1 Tax=Streptomyces sp. NPDC056663 TaxID=3345899 RepID=UPI0036D16B1E